MPGPLLSSRFAPPPCSVAVSWAAAGASCSPPLRQRRFATSAPTWRAPCWRPSTLRWPSLEVRRQDSLLRAVCRHYRRPHACSCGGWHALGWPAAAPSLCRAHRSNRPVLRPAPVAGEKLKQLIALRTSTRYLDRLAAGLQQRAGQEAKFQRCAAGGWWRSSAQKGSVVALSVRQGGVVPWKCVAGGCGGVECATIGRFPRCACNVVVGWVSG